MSGLSEEPRIEDLERRLGKDPASRAFLELAHLYHDDGRFEDAARTCAEGVRNNPDYLSARVLLGRIYFDMGLLEEAREAMDHVLERAPDNIVARRVVAEILLERGQNRAAMEKFKALLAFKPGDEDATRRVEEIERRLGLHDLPEADDDAAPEPAEALATPTLAEVYIQQGMPHRAIKLYREILCNNPDDAEVRLRLEAVERDHPLTNPAALLARRKVDRLSSWLRAIQAH